MLGKWTFFTTEVVWILISKVHFWAPLLSFWSLLKRSAFSKCFLRLLKYSKPFQWRFFYLLTYESEIVQQKFPNSQNLYTLRNKSSSPETNILTRALLSIYLVRTTRLWLTLNGRQACQVGRLHMNLFLAKECLRRIFKALSHCLCVMELWDVRLAEFNQRVRGRRGLLNSLVSFYYSVLYSVPSALSILKGLVVALVEYF